MSASRRPSATSEAVALTTLKAMRSGAYRGSGAAAMYASAPPAAVTSTAAALITHLDMETSGHFADAVCNGGIQEREAERSQPRVRENGVALAVFREQLAEQQRRERSRQRQHAKTAAELLGELGHDVVEASGLIVREEIPAADSS